jgi:hypothetical protein
MARLTTSASESAEIAPVERQLLSPVVSVEQERRDACAEVVKRRRYVMSRWRGFTQVLFATTMVGLTSCVIASEDGPLGETEEPLSTGLGNAVPSGVATTVPTIIPTTSPTIAPTISPTVAGPVVTGPLELSPLHLVGVWYIDLTNGNMAQVPRVNGHFTWPSPYDLVPLHVHFVWEPAGSLSSTEIPKIVAGQGYDIELRVDDQTLTQASNGGPGDFYTSIMTGGFGGCPVGKTCLGTSVSGAKMFEFPGVWDMKIAFWSTLVPEPVNKKFVTGYVSPNATHTSYFAEKISPIFKHERCSTCHSLGSKNLLVAQHHGLISASGITETVTPRGTQLRCGSGCHVSIANSVPGESFNETEWMVPKFDMGIDWTGKNAAQICATVTSKLTTEAALEEHFFEDARIAWAVHSGVVPNGTAKPKAPPGNFADFRSLMYAWILGGRPCP